MGGTRSARALRAGTTASYSIAHRGGLPNRFLQSLEAEAGAPSFRDDHGLLTRQQIEGGSQLGDDVMRNHDRAMPVGMKQVPGAHDHSMHIDLAIEAHEMDEGV